MFIGLGGRENFVDDFDVAIEKVCISAAELVPFGSDRAFKHSILILTSLLIL